MGSKHGRKRFSGHRKKASSVRATDVDTGFTCAEYEKDKSIKPDKKKKRRHKLTLMRRLTLFYEIL